MTEYRFEIIEDGASVGTLSAEGLIRAIEDGVLREGDTIKVEELA